MVRQRLCLLSGRHRRGGIGAEWCSSPVGAGAEGVAAT
jgi:hypothetical protein